MSRSRPPEQRAAAAARVKALRQKRRAAGLRADGAVPTPKPRRTQEEKRAAAVKRQQRYEAKKRGKALSDVGGLSQNQD
jgi:hypothetical protein